MAPEIVHVVDEHTLIDAESYQRTPPAGVGRFPGFYIVGGHESLPGARAAEAGLIGPFDTREDAIGWWRHAERRRADWVIPRG